MASLFAAFVLNASSLVGRVQTAGLPLVSEVASAHAQCGNPPEGRGRGVICAPPNCRPGTCTSGADPDGNYYGIALLDNAPSNSGADGEVYVSQGSVYDFHHIGETLWEGTNNDPNGNSWVEGGFHYVGNNNQLSLYWAEWPPGGNYSSHPVTGVTPSVNNWYDVQIKIIGYEEWGVYVDQVYQGYSPQPGWSENLSAGLESTSSTNRLSDSETGPLRYEQNNGTWVTNWPSATFLYCNSPANVWWAVVDQTVADSM